MTTEQRERMAHARAAKAAKARVEVRPNEPNQPTVSTQTAFLAAHQSDRIRSTDEVKADGVTGAATHTRPGTVVMYKPTERSGWLPRTVSAAAIPMLLYEGWKEFCPDCGRHHVDERGNITTSPNACAARDPVAIRRCPVCRKRLFDNASYMDMVLVREEDDIDSLRIEAIAGDNSRGG